MERVVVVLARWRRREVTMASTLWVGCSSPSGSLNSEAAEESGAPPDVGGGEATRCCWCDGRAVVGAGAGLKEEGAAENKKEALVDGDGGGRENEGGEEGPGSGLKSKAGSVPLAL